MKEPLLPTLALIGVTVLFGVLGQTTLKLGVNRVEMVEQVATGPLAVVLLILRSPLMLLGLAMYGLGAFTWIVVLSRVDLSYAYPFLALNFVLVAVVSQLVLAESIPGLRWLGIVVICAGILIVARSTQVS
jgi:drug/metabolite transporter (DMT)-like permease